MADWFKTQAGIFINLDDVRLVYDWPDGNMTLVWQYPDQPNIVLEAQNAKRLRRHLDGAAGVLPEEEARE